MRRTPLSPSNLPSSPTQPTRWIIPLRLSAPAPPAHAAHWHSADSAVRRYESELSSNYGSDYVARFAGSKSAICTDDGQSPVAFFYGERVGANCRGNCFQHRYGGGVRMFEFLAYEMRDGLNRFKCPQKSDENMCAIASPRFPLLH